MIKIFALLVVVGTVSAMAQRKEPIVLWPAGAPGALGKSDKDIPTLTPYIPDADKATGAAMVICPGGGYGGLSAHEGNDYALFLNQHGVTAFVLKYRLGSGGLPASVHVAGRCARSAYGAVASRRVEG